MVRIRIKKATYWCGKSSTHSHFKKASYSHAKEPFVNATNTGVIAWLESTQNNLRWCPKILDHLYLVLRGG